MNLTSFTRRIKKENWGIELVRKLDEYESLNAKKYISLISNLYVYPKKPEDLIRIANLISPKTPLLSIYPTIPNKCRKARIVGSEKDQEWLNFHFGATYPDKIIDNRSLLPTSQRSEGIEIEYEAILSQLSHLSHLDKWAFRKLIPCDSFLKKIQILMTYEIVRECQEIARFLFDIRNTFYFPFDKGFKILFSINYNGRRNGVIDEKGLVQFANLDPLFFNELQITKIQRCEICQKFIWVSKAKNNVSKTCKGKLCVPELKKIKNDDYFDKNKSTIYRNRKLAASLSDFKPSPNQLTQKNFDKIFRRCSFSSSLYKAWAKTYEKECDPQSRSLGEIYTENSSLVLDLEIFKRYPPVLIKTPLEANRKSSNFVNVIITEHTFIFMARYYEREGDRRLPRLWVNAGTVNVERNLYGPITGLPENSPIKKLMNTTKFENEKLSPVKTEQEVLSEFNSRLASLSLNMLEEFSPDFDKSDGIERFAFLAKCEAFAISLLTSAPVVTDDRNFYLNRSGLPKVLDASSLFEKFSFQP